MFVQKYSIAARIGMMAATSLFLMLVLVVVEIRGLNSIKDSLDEIVDHFHQRSRLVQQMRYQARNSAVLVRNILLVRGAQQQEEARRFAEAEQEYRQTLTAFAALNHLPQGRHLLAIVQDKGQKTFTLWHQVVTAGLAGSPDQGVAILLADLRLGQRDWLAALNELVAFEEEGSKSAANQALADYEKTKIWLAVINLLAMGTGLCFVLAITASIVKPLREITRQVDAVGEGDLSARVARLQQDEIGRLGARINHMVDKLQINELELEEYRQNLEEIVEWRTSEINDQRERFISVLIHDLKSPLVPIIGLSQLLMTKTSLSGQKVIEYAAAIHDSSTKLSATIEKTSLELKERRLTHKFDSEPFDLEELLCWVVRNMRHELAERNIELRLNHRLVDNYRCSGQLVFRGDSLKLRSVIENLLSNAVKYTCTSIDVSLNQDNDWIALSFADDGQGVDSLYRQRIFEEYFQPPGSRGGTGVGLYSVKKIVEYYEGSVEVADTPGPGAKFVVRLPLAAVGQPAQSCCI